MNPLGAFFFKDVTLLITHYNRSQSLVRLLTSFQDLNCRFEQIVVSDDGSRPEHLQCLQRLGDTFDFELITTPRNRGLGHNINKGQNAVKTPYTLYVQEDFEPSQIFPEKFVTALSLMNEQPDVDITRFYAYFEYPYLTPIRDGFCAIDFGIWKSGYRKFYVYSDHPHLRRSTFCKKFGPYLEGVKGDDTEYAMMMSFLAKKGKAIYYKDYNALFYQLNSEDEPSTMKRNFLRESNNPLVKSMRHAYRHLKFNRDYALTLRQQK